MKEDQLFEDIHNIPVIPSRKSQIENGDYFETDEYGGHWRIFHKISPTEEGKEPITFLLLEVTGDQVSKDTIVEDFIEAFGVPLIPRHTVMGMDILSWRTSISRD